MNPEKTYTMKQFIDCGGDVTISYDLLSFIEKTAINNHLISYNILNDYFDEFMRLAVTVELSNEDRIKYMYKPKLLAYDVYNSTELYFIILYLNNMCDVKEFNISKVRMLKKDALEFVLSSIFNANKKVIEEYNNK